MAEAKLVRAVFRETIGDNLEIECTFDDGQKGVMVEVDGDFPELANWLLEQLQMLAEDVK
jgi:hypothetical protein